MNFLISLFKEYKIIFLFIFLIITLDLFKSINKALFEIQKAGRICKKSSNNEIISLIKKYNKEGNKSDSK